MIVDRTLGALVVEHQHYETPRNEANFPNVEGLGKESFSSNTIQRYYHRIEQQFSGKLRPLDTAPHQGHFNVEDNHRIGISSCWCSLCCITALQESLLHEVVRRSEMILIVSAPRCESTMWIRAINLALDILHVDTKYSVFTRLCRQIFGIFGSWMATVKTRHSYRTRTRALHPKKCC